MDTHPAHIRRGVDELIHEPPELETSSPAFFLDTSLVPSPGSVSSANTSNTLPSLWLLLWSPPLLSLTALASLLGSRRVP